MRFNLKMVMRQWGLMGPAAPATEKDPIPLDPPRSEMMTIPAPDGDPEMDDDGVGSIYVSVDIDPAGFNR